MLKSVFEDVNVSSIVQDTFVGNFNIEVIKSKATMQRGYRSMYDGDLPNMIIQIAKDAYPHFNTNSENDSYYKELDLKRIEESRNDGKEITFEWRQLKTVFQMSKQS